MSFYDDERIRNEGSAKRGIKRVLARVNLNEGSNHRSGIIGLIC